MRNREKGFSLIELLIVVAIILIIAAIAIPNLLQSRQRANETSAAGSLRTVNTSEVTYQTTYGVGFAANRVTLGPGGGLPYTCTNAGLIDNVLASGFKSGYNFNDTLNNGIMPPGGAPQPAGIGVPPGGCPQWGVSGYAYQAMAQANQGKRGYYTDDSGVIRFCVAPDPATPCAAVFTDAALQ